ncbi:MAG TPA: universal stress protein [Bryobacteraceae bacterium]|jgi:nucleotide-binding universal stress UspA family protein
MRRIKHILFPVDFSERMCGSAPFVNAMASRFGARVTLLGVVQPPRYMEAQAAYSQVVVTDEELKRDLQLRLNGALQGELAGVPVEAIAKVGEPAEVITAFAHREGVDLIMMPTHGYGPFRQFLLGSVTAKVLHDAHCPVWTGAHVAETSGLGACCQTAMCALDGTPAGIPVLQWAVEFASAMGARLRLVHVIPSLPCGLERQEYRELERQLRDRARESIEKIGRQAGIKLPVCIAAGDIATSVREEARGHATDLLIIGRGAICQKLGRLRAHAYGIIREAPCPVISV